MNDLPVNATGRRRRLGGLAGVGFVACLLAAPDPSLREGVSADQTRDFYLANQQALGLMLILVGVGYVLFLYFVTVFQSEARRNGAPESLAALVLVAGALVAGFYVLGSALRAMPASATSANASIELVEAVARVGESSNDALVEIGTYWRGLLLATAAALVIRSRTVPRWVGWLAVLLAATSFAGGMSFVDSPLSAALGAIGFLSFALFHLWVLVAGIALTLSGRRGSNPDAGQQPLNHRVVGVT